MNINQNYFKQNLNVHIEASSVLILNIIDNTQVIEKTCQINFHILKLSVLLNSDCFKFQPTNSHNNFFKLYIVIITYDSQ